MNTIVFHPESDPNAVRDAAAILRQGGLLGIPTETVYGLGADALNEDAVSRIFLAKGRPQDNPLIIHVPDASWLERYCRDVPPAAYRLAERFWPGPLTMILPRRDIVPLQTTGGLETVGVRCPNHPVTLAIIEAAGVPIAAPSGNTSGRPSPTTAAHMIEDMDGRINRRSSLPMRCPLRSAQSIRALARSVGVASGIMGLLFKRPSIPFHGCGSGWASARCSVPSPERTKPCV